MWFSVISSQYVMSAHILVQGPWLREKLIFRSNLESTVDSMTSYPRNSSSVCYDRFWNWLDSFNTFGREGFALCCDHMSQISPLSRLTYISDFPYRKYWVSTGESTHGKIIVVTQKTVCCPAWPLTWDDIVSGMVWSDFAQLVVLKFSSIQYHICV